MFLLRYVGISSSTKSSKARQNKNGQKVEMRGPRLICDGCNTFLTPKSIIYHCRCQSVGFDLCLTCALNKPDLCDLHVALEACMVDPRDRRRTSIIGPSIDDLRSFVAELKRESSSLRLLKEYYQFFQSLEIKDIIGRDLAAEDRYESPSASSDSVTTKKVGTNYSLYKPLNAFKKEIRLAYIHPGQPNDPLIVNVHTVPYAWSDHTWVALSYTWGSIDETRRILLGHSQHGATKEEEERNFKEAKYVPFSCTANLEIALREIRREDEGHFFWIDALCINQSDLEERVSQVSMMTKIYSSAQMVVVWLGCDPKIDPAAERIRFLHLYLQAVKRMKGDPNVRQLSDYHHLEHIFHDEKSLPEPMHLLEHSEIAPHLAHFLANPWFSRAWVVQEVWAARDVMAIYSKRKGIPWEAIAQANGYASVCGQLRNCNRRQDPPETIEQEEKFRTAAMNGEDIWAWLRTPGDADKQPIPLLDLLDNVTTRLQAGDKRDLVFSILGMSTEANGVMHNSPLIVPDYKKPTWQVFADLTRWYINYYKSLNILGTVTHLQRGERANLDGKVPSWSISPANPPFWKGGGTLSERTPFEANDGEPLDTDLIGRNLGDRYLVTRGYEIDSVAWVDDCFLFPVPNFQGRVGQADPAPFPARVKGVGHDASTFAMILKCNASGLEWLWDTVREKRLLEDCDIPEHDEDGNELPPCRCQHTLDELLNTMTGDRWVRIISSDLIGRVKGDAIKYELYDMDKIYAYFASQWVVTTSDPEMQKFCGKLRKLLLPLVDPSLTDELAKGTMEASHRKSLCVTKGGALGVCPYQTQVGDSVAILFGCRVPVILRRTQDGESEQDTAGEPLSAESRWEFIGESYVNGVMDGGVTRNKRESGAPIQTFKLC